MQYTLLDLLQAENILLYPDVTDTVGVVEVLTEALEATGYVERKYAQDVLEREKVFPTGLPTEPIPVAIPHADPDHIQRSAVGIALLAEPVEFGLMGTDGSDKVAAQVVFLLAIKEREKQVEMLQQLIQLIQSGDVLQEMMKARTSQAVFALIKANS